MPSGTGYAWCPLWAIIADFLEKSRETSIPYWLDSEIDEPLCSVVDGVGGRCRSSVVIGFIQKPVEHSFYLM